MNPCFVGDNEKSELILKTNKHSFLVVARLREWTIVSKGSTHFADSFPIPKNHSKSKPGSHLVRLWLPRSRAFSISDQPTAFREFFNCFECGDLCWAPRTLNVTRTCWQWNPVKHFFTIDSDDTEYLFIRSVFDSSDNIFS